MHTHIQSGFQLKNEMKHYRFEWQPAQDCAGPLSHCLLLPEKEKGRGGKEGKKWLTVEKQVRHIEISFFFIIYD